MRVFRQVAAHPVAIVSLLLLPVAILVVAGLLLLRNDRLAVEAEARQATEVAASTVLRSFVHACTNYSVEQYLILTNLWPKGTLFLQISAGQLIFPPTLRTNASSNLAQQLVHPLWTLWAAAEASEFHSNNFAAAVSLWDKLLEQNLPDRAGAIARFQRAVLFERMGQTNTAGREFEALEQTSPDLRLESGLPIAPLAHLKQPASRSPLENRHASSVRFLSNLLAHPTEFSANLISFCSDTDLSETASNLWEQHEQARNLFPYLNVSSDTPPVMRLESGWAFRSGIDWIVRKRFNLQSLLTEVLEDLRPGSHVNFEIRYGAETVVSKSDSSSARRLWTVVAYDSASEFRCHAYLENDSILFSRQRQRARVFGGLLAAGLASAAFGAVLAQRSFARQRRLGELKSNFVSSVSHELRAPLGSIRLISEALQSGRVLDTEKQREYYKFLVDESRRVSGVIENVLEFSRIEQNSRSFEFEPVDLRAACLAAAKSVEPIATERAVNIALCLGEEKPYSRRGDALALQRAIINLLDNAIKHSTPGEAVMLALSRTANTFEIKVQDKGPGIPLSEQKRIFERFYRLGSELRRETQGVGIGLSIVQHTIESHGGSVIVQSSPGAGATFTLILPHDDHVQR